MHTSNLRPSDFRILQSEHPVTHQRCFQSITRLDRLGFVTGNPLDGLGDAALILAHVTAFYDRYREQGVDFLAYPDYFSFQDQIPVTDYGIPDIHSEIDEAKYDAFIFEDRMHFNSAGHAYIADRIWDVMFADKA